jgi:hypothetical protein
MERLQLSGSVFACFLFGLLISCASRGGAYKFTVTGENGDAVVLGSVQVEFTSSSGGISLYGYYTEVNETIKQQAYIKLKEKAASHYQGNIDIANIVVVYVNGGESLWNKEANFSATGDVIAPESRKENIQGIEGALGRAAEQTLKNVTARSKIGIVYITAQDRSTIEYIAGELEFIWVNDGYTIIDRSQLERLKQEQNFQMSGEVDDETAVSIGKFAGADIIVTGRVDGEGDLRRLRLRALETQTAHVVGVASERL